MRTETNKADEYTNRLAAAHSRGEERVKQASRDPEIVAEAGWGDPDRPTSGSISAFLKIPTRSPRRLVILSSKPLFYPGHYSNGFMHPHYNRHCQFCDRGVGLQDRLVFHCYDPILQVSGLLELPGERDGSGYFIFRCSEESRMLRSLMFDFHKEGGLKNGKIVPVGAGAWPDITSLPVEADLLAEMKKLWSKHSRSPDH